MFLLQKHKMENIKSLKKVSMGSFLSMFYFNIYNCISYVILRLILISIEIYFNFLKRSTILDYVSGSLRGSLTSALFTRFCYISDDG